MCLDVNSTIIKNLEIFEQPIQFLLVCSVWPFKHLYLISYEETSQQVTSHNVTKDVLAKLTKFNSRRILEIVSSRKLVLVKIRRILKFSSQI